MTPIDTAKIKVGDPVVYWDAKADALHTNARILKQSDGRIWVKPYPSAEPVGLTPRQAAKTLFAPPTIAEIQALQLSAIARHYDHASRMLILREDQLRASVHDDAIRADALVYSKLLRTLSELREKVETGEVMR